MDSTSIAFWLKPDLALTIDYGQRPAPGEIRAASAVCAVLAIEHHVITADVSALGSGDLAGTPTLNVAPAREWWPYRNQLLITLAAMKAVSLGADRLIIGALKTDGFHADGTTEFVAAMDGLLRLQEGGLQLVAPAQQMTAAELVKTSGIPFDVLAWSHSCHVSDYACGECRGCAKHYITMQELADHSY